MNLQEIVRRVNLRLAGEQLTFSQLRVFLDDTIFDINTRLNTMFPSFSEFTNDTFPENYPNYNFFPDKYIHNVVTLGAASKFYTSDEEGIESAPKYGQDYARNLFYMERDYSQQIPEEWQANRQGYIDDTLEKHISGFKITQNFW